MKIETSTAGATLDKRSSIDFSSFFRGRIVLIVSALIAAYVVHENVAIMSGESNSVVIGGGALEESALPENIPPCRSPSAILFGGNHLMGHDTIFTFGKGKSSTWSCKLPGCEYSFVTLG